MRQKHSLKKIVTRRIYSTEEVADLFKVHKQTIRVWRKEGLQNIIGSKSPYLFAGIEIKDFLTKGYSRNTVTLRKSQFYCLRCRKAVTPDSQEINFEYQNKILGNGKHSILLKGKCPSCNSTICKFSSQSEHGMKQSASKEDQQALF